MKGIELPVRVMVMRLNWPRLEIYYPVIYGLWDAGVQQTVNNAIFGQINLMIVEQGYFQNPKTTITGTFEIKNNQRGILSLTLSNYAFLGGAHGLTILKSVTTDIKTGRIYNLKDMFKPGIDYVKVLSEMVARQIKERNIPILGEFKGIRPNQDFYIADKAIVLYFQLNEITPYVFGFPHFLISVYDLEDMIDPEGPLGRMTSGLLEV